MELSGLVFGEWSVLKRTKNVGNRGTRWLCRCSCGRERVVNGSALNTGRSNHCGCKNPTRFISQKSGDAATNVLICRYQTGAIERGFSFALSYEQCTKLFSADCKWCGRAPFAILVSGTRKQYQITYTGIDRLDSSKGYTIENVAPCCKFCNRAKNTMSVDEFESWIQTIIEFRKST